MDLTSVRVCAVSVFEALHLRRPPEDVRKAPRQRCPAQKAQVGLPSLNTGPFRVAFLPDGRKVHGDRRAQLKEGGAMGRIVAASPRCLRTEGSVRRLDLLPPGSPFEGHAEKVLWPVQR